MSPTLFDSNTTDVRVAAIRQHVTIFDVFGRMGLSVSAETQQMKCPFHADTAPSARVYADQNKLYCFSCQKSWDVVEAARDAFGLSFHDALSWLEAQFGVPGGAISVAGTVRTRLLAKTAPDAKAAATSVEQLLISRKRRLGFVRYARLLQGLDVTVAEAAGKPMPVAELQQRLLAIVRATQ